MCPTLAIPGLALSCDLSLILTTSFHPSLAPHRSVVHSLPPKQVVRYFPLCPGAPAFSGLQHSLFIPHVIQLCPVLQGSAQTPPQGSSSHPPLLWPFQDQGMLFFF